MKKIAYGSDVVFVTMTPHEFLGLSGQSYADVEDGTSISLATIKNKIDLVDSKEAVFASLKGVAEQLIDSLDNLGV